MFEVPASPDGLLMGDAEVSRLAIRIRRASLYSRRENLASSAVNIHECCEAS
jgi:hypothetical protein